MAPHHLVVVGGFHRGFATASNATYTLDVTTSSSWQRQDDCPMDVTHAAFAIHHDRLFMCGGYRGGHPGPAVAQCWVYHHGAPRGTQWQALPDLPAARAGGGMTYDTTLAVLTFVGGATRELSSSGHVFSADAVDHDEAWMMAPHVTEPQYGGWFKQADFPLFGNHLSFVSTLDDTGRERHFFMGGQIGELEKNHNLDELYEYDLLLDQFFARANMPLARGHASSSTLPYACGFLLAGGSVNSGSNVKQRTRDISFYDPSNDTWSSIGQLYSDIKTPICGIWDDYMYCTTGYTRRTMRRRLKIVPAMP